MTIWCINLGLLCVMAFVKAGEWWDNRPRTAAYVDLIPSRWSDEVWRAYNQRVSMEIDLQKRIDAAVDRLDKVLMDLAPDMQITEAMFEDIVRRDLLAAGECKPDNSI